MNQPLLTKAEIDELKDDFLTYSGNIIDFKGVKLEGGTAPRLVGTARTSCADIRFCVWVIFDREKYWPIQVVDAVASLDNGGAGYTPYFVPRFSRHPGLREKVIAANKLLDLLASQPPIQPENSLGEQLMAMLRSEIGMPEGLLPPAQIDFCNRQIKMRPSRTPYYPSQN